MSTTTTVFGLEIAPSEYLPLRSVIGHIETSPNGNVILRVGREHNKPVHGSDRPGGWEQTEHVVLTPDEARDLIEALYATLEGDPSDELQRRADEIATADRGQGANEATT